MPREAADRLAAGRRRPSRETHVARFVTALARAVHAFHTYPPGSPARNDVIEAAREALRSCVGSRADAVSIDVTSEGLKVAGELVPTDQGPERALAIALRKTYVSTIEIGVTASTGDFRQFCSLMAFPDRILNRVEELPEILAQRGVEDIVAHVISTHQPIEAGTVPSGLLDLARRQAETRDRRVDAAEGGWIRLDPSVPLTRVSLEDLPLLLEDAPAVGMALDRMSRSAGSVSPRQALLRHYQEITDLYAACDATVSEGLFRRLAEIVLDLPDEARLELLRREVLPGLVDGRRSGDILRYFSEEEAADALWLLLDLGIGGVEMLTAGVANLDLPESRLEGVVQRLSRRLESEGLGPGGSSGAIGSDMIGRDALGGGPPGGDVTIRDALVRDAVGLDGRLSVDRSHDADLVALRSFDLSVDAGASASLDGIVRAVEEADPLAVVLRCCADILALSADPSIITATMRRSRGLFFDLESRGNLAELADWLASYARVARSRDDHDGEVAAIVRAGLDDYVTPEFIHRVSALPPQPGREPPLVTIICGLGRTGVRALIDSLAMESERAARNRLLTALQPRAGDLAEHLVEHLSHPEWYVTRNVLMLLGHAGPGWEDAVGSSIEHRHPRVIREAFIALARIGTEEAVERTALALRHPSAEVRRHAAEAIWRFESELSHPRVLEALADPRLVTDHPALVRRLIEAAGKRDLPGIGPVLRRLRWHCLAVWNGERRALGWCAFLGLRSSS